MRKFSPLILAIAALLTLASCKKESGSTATTLSDALAQAMNYEESDDAGNAKIEAEIARLPREETLYLVGFQWSPPYSFNPLAGWPDWPARPEFNLMYEQLTAFNSMTDEIVPLIGRVEQANNDFVSVILNPSAKWSDGKPLTAADVVFTYNLNLNSPDAPCSYIKGVIKEVSVDTLRTDDLVEERLYLWVDKEDRNNPLSVLDLISTVPILPAHVFEQLIRAAGGSVSTVAGDPMTRPHVISGPYNYLMHSNEKIVVKRRDDYWGNNALHDGKMPAPKYVVHPIYKGNDHSSAALRKGELDVSSNFMPRVWLKKTVNTWFEGEPYFKPGAIPMFIINATNPPLSSKHYRRAMAFGIDYEKIKNLAVSGYTTDLQPGLIMPFSAESAYFSQEEVDKYGASIFDPERAKEELRLGGFKPQFDKKGILLNVIGPDGNPVPTVGIMCPSGWTDFELVVKNAVESMRSVGIDVRENFVDGSKYYSVMETGDFDLYFDTPASMRSKSTPWSRFEVIMSSRNFRPIGQRMQNNKGRWNNPESSEHISQVDSLLNAIPLMENEEQKKEAYKLLNRIYMEEQPTLPVLYRPEEYYEFSTKYWTNFPTEKNPYAPPRMPVASAGTRMLWELVPTGGR
ncbi:MAG: ABC transporter substrate-binding protein [Chitinivibrionia bacterium]|nr:ABC transporter substrate-binding protein [Chitinivibrionia bacterium]